MENQSAAVQSSSENGNNVHCTVFVYHPDKLRFIEYENRVSVLII